MLNAIMGAVGNIAGGGISQAAQGAGGGAGNEMVSVPKKMLSQLLGQGGEGGGLMG